MFQTLGRMFGGKPPQKRSPVYAEPTFNSPLTRRTAESERKHSYTRIFRYRLPDGHTEEPKSVEIVGSFSKWQRVPLLRDGMLDSWHAAIHHIPGNKTHHYMLLVNGKPAYDKLCDGLATPHGMDEQLYQLETEKGPRVLMLFAQTK
jgi:hypothetical protein